MFMLKPVIEFGVGLLFGLGLLISGMADPNKVLAFLDLSGAWDPSLALVMAGAIAVGVIGYAFARQRQTTFLKSTMHWPQVTQVDRPLLIGSAMFGAGWGLAGFCPGPALVSAGSGQPKAILFVFALLLGMLALDLTRRLAIFSPTKRKVS
jgi:uncharacterized protein